MHVKSINVMIKDGTLSLADYHFLSHAAELSFTLQRGSTPITCRYINLINHNNIISVTRAAYYDDRDKAGS